MSENKENPFEELKQQLQEILSGSGKSSDFSREKSEGVSVEPPPSEEDLKAQETLERIKAFNLKPREIRDYLNRFVIKQDEAKKVLSVAVCDHYNHVRRCLADPNLLQKDYSKPNIILLGPTGVGKTYLMRTVARMIGVPFVRADATKFSETGYVGGDVEDIVRNLVKAANGNVELAQYGIVYIDEIDKIANDTQNGGRDISGRGVQINLLKLMEDTEVNLVTPTDVFAQMQAAMSFGSKKDKKSTINTRHILFIVSGAFDRLSEIIKRRLAHSSIGFAAGLQDHSDEANSYLAQSATADFIQYGFEPEFIGRLPVRVSCENLNEEDLALILNSSEGSILHQYKEDFSGYTIDLNLTQESIREIAHQAAKEKTGARGLMTVLERLFRNFKFELPSTAIRSLEITTDTLQNPKQALQKMLQENSHLQRDVFVADLKLYTDDFKKEHELELIFDAEATEALIARALENDKTIRALCQQLFKDFPHGLKIVARQTQKKVFTIPVAAVQAPDKTLSRWITECFK